MISHQLRIQIMDNKNTVADVLSKLLKMILKNIVTLQLRKMYTVLVFLFFFYLKENYLNFERELHKKIQTIPKLPENYFRKCVSKIQMIVFQYSMSKINLNQVHSVNILLKHKRVRVRQLRVKVKELNDQVESHKTKFNRLGEALKMY